MSRPVAHPSHRRPRVLASRASIGVPGMRFDSPDLARAEHDANRALKLVDWSKRDIVVWVPGTSDHEPKPKLVDAVKATFPRSDSSFVTLDYVSTWELKSSAPTAVETVRRFLDGARRQLRPGQRLLIAGESQGAWAIGECLADPMLRRVVTRAAIFGHPQLAATHYEDAHDPGVLEQNHEGDPVSVPLKGDPNDAMEGISLLYTGKALSNIPLLGRVLVQNTGVALTIIGNYLRGMGLLPKNPNDRHDYAQDFLEGARFLRSGSRPPAANPAPRTPR